MLDHIPDLAEQTEELGEDVRRQTQDIGHFRWIARFGGDIAQNITSLESGFEQRELEAPPTPDHAIDASQSGIADRLIDEA